MDQRAELVEQFTDVMSRFTAYFGKHLPEDVYGKLQELRAQQHTEMAGIIYDAMFKDLALAEQLDRPICQDTGVIQYFIEVGDRFPILGAIPEALKEATRRATVNAPLRHNAVQIFEEKNTGNNTGKRIPWLDWDIVPDSDECTIYAYMAGGGCSLPGTAKVLMPVEGYEGIVQYVFDTMVERGINACPPVLVGIGIGGSVEVAARLSKKALMRPVGSRHPNARGAEMEKRLQEGLDRLNIGPGGLTGVNSVMGVHIEEAARHPSCLAVGISMGCWAHRRAGIKWHSDMSYELLSYPKGVL